MNQVVQLPSNQEQVVRREFEEKLKKALTSKRVLSAVGAVVALAIISSLAIAALKAGLALAAIAVLLAAAGVSVKMLPYWQLRIENRVSLLIMQEKNAQLARLKAEARKNPIEQRENSLSARIEQLKKFREFLTSTYARLETWSTRLTDRKSANAKAGTTEDLSKEEQAVAKLRLYYKNRKERYDTAVKASKEQGRLLESLRFKWEFAKEGGELAGILDPNAEDAFLQNLLDDEAAKSVEMEFNKIFAALDIDVAEINETKALEFAPGMTIDVSAIHIDQPELVPAQLTSQRS